MKKEINGCMLKMLNTTALSLKENGNFVCGTIGKICSHKQSYTEEILTFWLCTVLSLAYFLTRIAMLMKGDKKSCFRQGNKSNSWSYRGTSLEELLQKVGWNSKQPDLIAGVPSHWVRWPLRVPANPDHSMILWIFFWKCQRHWLS